eukprot:CAMPEP_0197649010 /NCGR_PEP_ID=MMETSP1338-20131121/28096_1 /TAXON_ID=43686 ORGANISM="Pelagodinium beii, Strain RCC1491" /NCGR_SAMPLE_ID=MMETSP1338 /ASSEMBLY_ACC=CAM_ASM_000754 /LENGTH=667 /DNA_ID=CAMNT_0043223105 /DNA_START=85 /DNA_END=2088 /DNA_ORIENTATION=+
MALFVVALADSDNVSPVARVVELLEGMETKVKAQGAAEDAKAEEFTALCSKRSDALGYEIKTGTADIEELTATISKAESKLESVASGLTETAGSISQSEADLQAATDVREKESSDYKAAETDLLEVASTIERAINTLEKEEKKGAAALVQVQNAPNLLQALKVMMDASMLGEDDAKKLSSLLQDGDGQAPVPAAYEKKTGGVVEMLEDMLDKSKDELSELRKKEMTAKNNFELVTQSLQDELKFNKESQQKSKKVQAEQQTVKAGAAKDLQEAQSTLDLNKKTLADFSADCRQEAADYKEETKSRALELEALSKAKAALEESMPASFLQLQQIKSVIHNTQDLHHFEVVRLVRSLGKANNDQQLVLLSRRIDSVLRDETGASADVFAKITKMIGDMIASMEKNLQEAASKKAYCDAEMAKSDAKKEDKDAELEDVSTKIDKTASKIAVLKQQVTKITEALSALSSTQVEMTKLRQSETSLYEKSEPETVQGLEGVKTAINLLKNFYKGSTSSTSETRTGAAGGIIGRLEDAESDMAMELSEMRATERTRAADFEKDMNEMKLEKVSKESDVKYKSEEVGRLDSELVQLDSDKQSLATEMGAIKEFHQGLEAECLVTPESFAEKQAKKQQEIDGLKSALEVLSTNSSAPATMLLQRQSKFLRGHQLKA